ncbi:single-stranded-DNA-specific exonuclease RecJ [Ahniella affigens]|uniref:single-stranded-DNA-specific exonuclease RecJ n=1 Tax=Ahniella affigens TaxID=2021234 RepID=UPI001F0CADA0|nr:single-stranded-DNA-specific exonuclease RecJ [Ahniella affigens]
MKRDIQRRQIDPRAPLLRDERWPLVLRRLYVARGIHDAEALDLRLKHLHAPDSLSGLAAAVTLLVRAIVDGQRILVVGDFDADGATGTAVAIRGLRLLGARAPSYRVPNRFVHGYGLSAELVAELGPEQPELLITVDSGINCVTGVAAARARGIKVLVTDHHLPGPIRPEADAIVNPNQFGDDFPSKALAGVGVMFYLLIATRAALRGQSWFGSDRPEPDFGTLLDLVALGTVADLVPLDRNNRALVRAGLARMQAGQANAGIQALITASGRDPKRITAVDLGFALGPRINAAGRLEDMALGIECLLCDDPERAKAFAERLSSINSERQDVQAEMVEQAVAMLSGLEAAPEQLPKAVCLFDPDWHQGVVGLVASKIKERLHRPVLAFAPDAQNDALLKGSARSVAGVHLRDLLADLDARHPGLIQRFGGHAMAAGLTVARADFDRFRHELRLHADRAIAPNLLGAIIETDGPLVPSELVLETALAIQQGGPFGQGFPEPLFDGEFDILDASIMAGKHLNLQLQDPRTQRRYRAVWFSGYTGQLPHGRWHLVYQPTADEWRGETRFRLLIRHAQPTQ